MHTKSEEKPMTMTIDGRVVQAEVTINGEPLRGVTNVEMVTAEEMKTPLPKGVLSKPPNMSMQKWREHCAANGLVPMTVAQYKRVLKSRAKGKPEGTVVHMNQTPNRKNRRRQEALARKGVRAETDDRVVGLGSDKT